MSTFQIAIEPNFLDIDLSFERNRRSGDIKTVNGIDSIVASVVNLINTNFYDKPFRPSIGSNVRKLLFENINALTSTFILQSVTQTIQNYEPRVTLLDVVVDPDPENNRYNIKIVFLINSNQKTVDVKMFLERVR